MPLLNCHCSAASAPGRGGPFRGRAFKHGETVDEKDFILNDKDSLLCDLLKQPSHEWPEEIEDDVKGTGDIDCTPCEAVINYVGGPKDGHRWAGDLPAFVIGKVITGNEGRWQYRGEVRALEDVLVVDLIGEIVTKGGE